mmetsp:Transcript_66598/g.157201  ORF Transcript_66598/g.157201 Transcript_66598/m.157201 type:complete len:82 (+) Transcript_66598:491-736(+)
MTMYRFGIRSFYLCVPVGLWQASPWLMLLTSVLMTPLLYFIDTTDASPTTPRSPEPDDPEIAQPTAGNAEAGTQSLIANPS